MKLAQIWNSTTAWAAVAAMKKPPKLAYRLLKYEKKVQKELDACSKMRDSIIFELAGVEAPKNGEVVMCDISGDPEKMADLHKRLTEQLQVESDLEWIGISMDTLIDGLSADGNVLKENDLDLLEPFFTEPATA